MDSCRNRITAILLFVFATALPFFASADDADFLFVSAEVSQDSFNNVAIDQKVVDTDSVILHSAGSYEMRLIADGSTISSNFFEIPAIGEMEVIAENKDQERLYGTHTPDFQIVRVALPISQSLNPESSRLQILRNGNMLFDKELSELSLDVISTNEIATSNENTLLPPPMDGESGGGGLGLLIIGIVFAILAVAGYLAYRKRAVLLSLVNKNRSPK